MLSNIHDIEAHIQKLYRNQNKSCCPNMKIVKKVISENMSFLNDDLE